MTMTLPQAFEKDMQAVLSADEYTAFAAALTQNEQPTSIRRNPLKSRDINETQIDQVPWCAYGQYLSERPVFTTDPLLHAGCYYVQEASSMFLSQVIGQYVSSPVTYLDLCAAPGGKTTLALSALPQGSCVICNEIDRKRSRILAENIQKWGYPNVIVTANAPADFASLTQEFDVILTDVPCSGEGMFRKDENAVKEWSPANVQQCVDRQHEILNQIWPTLKPGGLLIYSTCTFNTHEDEEMIAYICDELGGEALSVDTQENWHIHPPLMGERPCYRFMPHYTQGEGLFMAVIRKHSSEKSDISDMNKNGNPDIDMNCNFEESCSSANDQSYSSNNKKNNKGKSGGKGGNKDFGTGGKKGFGKGKAYNNGGGKVSSATTMSKAEMQSISTELNAWLNPSEGPYTFICRDNTFWAIPAALKGLYDDIADGGFYLLVSGIEMATIKGKDLIPAHGLALSTVLNTQAFAQYAAPLETALKYLRRDSISLQEADENGQCIQVNGYVLVCYHGHPLGFVKNIGLRCNNMYPQEWRIRFL